MPGQRLIDAGQISEGIQLVKLKTSIGYIYKHNRWKGLLFTIEPKKTMPEFNTAITLKDGEFMGVEGMEKDAEQIGSYIMKVLGVTETHVIHYGAFVSQNDPYFFYFIVPRYGELVHASGPLANDKDTLNINGEDLYMTFYIGIVNLKEREIDVGQYFIDVYKINKSSVDPLSLHHLERRNIIDYKLKGQYMYVVLGPYYYADDKDEKIEELFEMDTFFP